MTTAPAPCSGTLTDARLAVPDLLEVLQRIRIDLLALEEPHCLTDADQDRRRGHRVNALAARLQDVMEDSEAMPTADDVDCGYDGEVDEVYYARPAQLLVWTCPRCGYQNETDAPEGPDPDDARDAMLDAARIETEGRW